MPRFHFARVSFAREKAAALRDALRPHLPSVRLGECREAYARICGYRNWHELVRVTEGGGAVPSPLVVEAEAGDAAVLAPAFGISPEVASEVLACVRPRALSAKAGGNGVVLPSGWEGIAADLRSLLGPAACLSSRLFLMGGEFGSDRATALNALAFHRAAWNPRERIAVVYRDDDFVPTEISEFGAGQMLVRKGPDAVQSAMRMVPSVILCTKPTWPRVASDLLRAAVSGHAVYTTSSHDGVGKVVAGLFDPFRVPDHVGMAAVVAEALGVVCTQRSVRGAESGSRVVLREFAVFEDEARRRLRDIHPSAWAEAVERMMADGSIRSQTYAQAAEAAFAAGLIDGAVRNGVLDRPSGTVVRQPDGEGAIDFRTVGPFIAAGMRRDLGAAMSRRSGLFLMNGRPGGGKMLTLRSLVQDVADRNPGRRLRIVGPGDYPSGRDGWPETATWHGGIDEPLEAGLADAARLGPAVILSRMPRDGAEMRGVVRTALSGNACYAAIEFAGGVGAALGKLLETFPADERELDARALAAALTVVCSQHMLVPSDGGGMVPIREFLVFDDRVRTCLAQCPPAGWSEAVAELMSDPSVASGTAEASAHAAFARGEIDGRRRDRVLGWLSQEDAGIEGPTADPKP